MFTEPSESADAVFLGGAVARHVELELEIWRAMRNLGPREMRILALFLDGRTMSEIADALQVSPDTVTHALAGVGRAVIPTLRDAPPTPPQPTAAVTSA